MPAQDMGNGAAVSRSCVNPQYYRAPKMSCTDGAFPTQPMGSFPTCRRDENIAFGSAATPPSLGQQQPPVSANVFGCLVPAMVLSPSTTTTARGKKSPSSVSQRTPPPKLSPRSKSELKLLGASKRLLCHRRLVVDDSTNAYLFHDDDDELPLLREHSDQTVAGTFRPELVV